MYFCCHIGILISTPLSISKKQKMEKKHYNIIDFVRTILITLVILIHIVNFGNLYPDTKEAILSFLMPAFLLITGYLVNINKPVKDFGLYLLRIFLPYAIMVTGYAILSLYLPVRDGISEFSIYTISRIIFISAIGPYWFFHAMIVCGIIYYISFNVYRKLSTIAHFSIFAFLLLLTAQYTPFLSIKSAVYYFIGAGIQLYFHDFSKIYKSSFWPVLPFLLIISNKEFRDWGALSVLIAVICFISFTAKTSEYVKGKPLKIAEYIGRNTFPIYIFHPIFTMGAKYLLPIFSFDSTGLLHTAITIILCIIGSLAIGNMMDCLHLSYLFGKKQIMR